MPALSYERLSFLDTSFLALETPETHMHVASVATYGIGDLATPDGGLDFPRIRRHIEARLHLVPRYRQKLAWIPLEQYPVWIDDTHFNLDYHVRHTALPHPGGEEQLKVLAGRLMSQQLDRAKPLWEMWFAEGLADDRFALIAKVHHCMIDGVAGVDLMAVLLDLMPTDEPGDPVPWTPRPEPSGAELVVGETARLTRTAIELAKGIGRGAREVASGHLSELRQALTSRTSAVSASLRSGWLVPSSETPINERIGPNRRFTWAETPLEDLKTVRRAFKVTVNDVVLAVASGAIRKFLVEHRGFDADGVDIRAMNPVSVRAGATFGDSGNQVAMWLVHLPVHEPDPASRVRFVAEQTATLKQERHAEGAAALVQSAAATPTRMLSAGLKAAEGIRPFNLTITNVPGPQFPLWLEGAPLQAIYPIVPLWQYHGLGIALFSYLGKIHWGIMGDWDLVPDIETFVDCVYASLAELLEAAAAEASP